jgi:hypothetical protein
METTSLASTVFIDIDATQNGNRAVYSFSRAHKVLANAAPAGEWFPLGIEPYQAIQEDR